MMMRSLFISTARGVEVNTRLVLKAATSALSPQPLSPTREESPQADGSSSSSSKSDAGLDVFVHVHDRSRATFLLHAQHLYGAVLAASPMLSIDVIPILSSVRLSSGVAGERGADAADAESDAALYAMACAPFPEQQGRPSDGGDGGCVIQRFARDTMEAERDKGFAPLYRYVAVGGTFDHLHSGHKLLLTTAALFATEKLRCGVTGDALLHKKKFAEHLQSAEERRRGAARFLAKIRPDLEVDLDTITEVSGGTDRIAEVEALAVSPETERALLIINEMRAKNGGLAPLQGIPIPFVMSPSGHVISSTEIRQRMGGGSDEVAEGQ